MQITAAQLRAARALLNMSQDELASRAGVGRRAVADYERGARVPYDRTLATLRATMEDADVVFLFEGERAVGVRIR